MALDQATHEKVIAHLQTKWITGCPMCGQSMWAVHGHILLPLSPAPGQMVIGGPILPCAGVTCQNCGNTMLVNLVVAGVLTNG